MRNRILYEFYTHCSSEDLLKPWFIIDSEYDRILCHDYRLKVENDKHNGLDLLDTSIVLDYLDFGTYIEVLVEYDSDI